MRKKKRIAVFLTSLILCMILSGTSVQASGLKTAEGRVDIELKEYMLDAHGKEVGWKDIVYAMPGQKISKIPRITNLAAKCQVRAKIEMRMGQEVEIPVTTDMLEGMSTDWSLHTDGYYYYEGELNTGESTDLFQGFTIPDVWDTRYGENGQIAKYYTENSIDVIVTVEAVGDENWKGEKTTVVSPKTGDDGKGKISLAVFLGAAVILTFLGIKESIRKKKVRIR